jgi:hypothetical protein
MPPVLVMVPALANKPQSTRSSTSATGSESRTTGTN